jgi:hypothetical protein
VLAAQSDETQAVARLARALVRSTPEAGSADRVALLVALAKILEGQAGGRRPR